MSEFQLHLPLLLIMVATIVGILTVSYGMYYIRRYGRTQQVTTFTVLATAITIWTVFAMLQLTATSYALSFQAYKLLHFGSFTTSPAVLFYALSIGDARRWVNWKTVSIAVLLLLPAFGWLFTDPVPILIRDPQLVSFGAFSVIEHGNSPIYTAYLSSFYILATIGLAYIVYQWHFNESISSMQAAILVPAIFAPMLLSVAQTFHLLPIETPGTILTPTSFSLGMTGIGYAAFRYEIFDTKSLARSQTISKMNEGYLLANTDGVIIDANCSAGSMLEPRTPLVGTQVREVFPTVDDHIKFDERDSKLFDTSIETEIGSRTYEVTVSNFVNNGQPLGSLLVVRDVTVRKQQERALKAREEKYRTLFEDTRDALMVFDRDGYRDCNEETLELFGINSVEDFLEYSPWELSPQTQPDGRDSKKAAQERIETAFAEGEAFFEWTHQRIDGTEFPAEVKLSKFEYKGEPAIQALIRDITDRKQRERELQEREAKYRNLFEDTRDALMLLDRDGFFDCNQRTLELFGVDSVEAFTNYQPWDLSPSIQPDGADSKEAAGGHVKTAFEEGEAFFEWMHQRTDGSEFPAEVKLSRFEHDGEPALHALVRDITERKEYERRLETQRDKLTVLNQVLRHDIRNDLQLITAYGELIEDQCDDDELQEHVETVLENADHAVELTKSAREMADVMLSTDKELQQVSLPAVLESEIEDVRDSFPEAAITYEEALPMVSVQANDMLGSVFRNLLKNAIQHNDKELPKVTISAVDHDETVVVRVADNGPGVPEVQKEAIFGKGEKGLDSQGTGIGLYLVKTLVESYSGKIWVEDREGESVAAYRPDATDRTEREGRDTRADSGGKREGAVFVVELPKVEDG